LEKIFTPAHFLRAPGDPVIPAAGRRVRVNGSVGAPVSAPLFTRSETASEWSEILASDALKVL